MIILINGPLGIGKTTLAEALMESVRWSAMLDGDHLVVANPPPDNEIDHLHSTIALLVTHYRNFGYRHFIINHIWTKPGQIEDLRFRLADLDADFHCFLLNLSVEENLQRIERRASLNALDESEHDLYVVKEELKALGEHSGADLGEPFHVSASPSALVQKMLHRLGLPA